MSDPWPLIHAERQALAQDLAGLSDEQWAHPSLCSGWSVRDLTAHLVATTKMVPGKFIPAFVASGFRINNMVAKALVDQLGTSPADTLANFRASIPTRTHPPGPAPAWLGEIVVHSADIRQPLGLPHKSSPESMTAAADFYKRSNLVIGTKRRIAGLSLRATDVDWATGTGPEVEGPMASLLLVMAGRPAGASDLTGPGVGTLQGRLGATRPT